MPEHRPSIQLPASIPASSWLAAIIDSSDDAIVSKTLDGIVTTWNRGAERIFGYTAKEIIGQPITLIIPEERRQEEPAILRRLRSGERVDHFETTRRRKDGRLIEVSVTISPVQTPDGRIVGISKIARDITEAKQVERELKTAKEAAVAAREQAVAANRAKDDFLAALSHELRTPLNPVLLTASAGAEDHELPEALRKDFKMIADNIAVQARLIDDLLDYNRLARGKLALSPISLDVHQALREAVAAVRDDIEAKSLRLSFSLDAAEHQVQSDPVRLLQVFWNALRNAVKFTPKGGEINIATLLPEDRTQIEIRFRDTGIGMTPAELEHIFRPFVQGRHAQDRGSAYGGLGLGLAICRSLVEAHRGSIWAESPGPDRGATLIIRLPLERAGA
ncbi:MAG TPA: PAS domain S-box protein [Opitutaceae bacterium]|nr:PAS domain S-box protein [Opitutaceae bacterium]